MTFSIFVILNFFTGLHQLLLYDVQCLGSSFLMFFTGFSSLAWSLQTISWFLPSFSVFLTLHVGPKRLIHMENTTLLMTQKWSPMGLTSFESFRQVCLGAHWVSPRASQTWTKLTVLFHSLLFPYVFGHVISVNWKILMWVHKSLIVLWPYRLFLFYLLSRPPYLLPDSKPWKAIL